MSTASMLNGTDFRGYQLNSTEGSRFSCTGDSTATVVGKFQGCCNIDPSKQCTTATRCAHNKVLQSVVGQHSTNSTPCGENECKFHDVRNDARGMNATIREISCNKTSLGVLHSYPTATALLDSLLLTNDLAKTTTTETNDCNAVSAFNDHNLTTTGLAAIAAGKEPSITIADSDSRVHILVSGLYSLSYGVKSIAIDITPTRPESRRTSPVPSTRVTPIPRQSQLLSATPTIPYLRSSNVFPIHTEPVNSTTVAAVLPSIQDAPATGTLANPHGSYHREHVDMNIHDTIGLGVGMGVGILAMVALLGIIYCQWKKDTPWVEGV
ncbi:hypothetical protein FKW77_004536 [Venturia effusa]|uniref:Uncharacterized protein n=1 Tax=Venturia effusa TaxID=50376 RepID=A0A517LR65_9PEZI|nr:hypothetical protein FKW77_004536 [Venturia effusa]